jgi:hypothetical protein
VTWDSSQKSASITLSNGNKSATSNNTVPQTVLGTKAIPTNKLVAFEIIITTTCTDWAGGIANHSYNKASNAGLGGDLNGVGYYVNTPVGALYFNGNLLASWDGPIDANGAALSVITNGTNIWVSTPVMRNAGFQWNNSNTADPASGVGGGSFAGMPTPIYPAFNALEGGGVATLNGGDTTFSTFLQNYMSAHSSVTSLSAA